MKDLWDYPIFISYPRTGAHFINYLMEMYFERPRLRVSHLYGDTRTDYKWFHDHDIQCQNKKDIYLYLYRDPIDTIFSYCYYKYEKDQTDNNVIETAKEYKKHLLYYLINKNIKSKKYIKYENFLKDDKIFINEFKKIINVFDEKVDKEKILYIRGVVDKQRIQKSIKKIYNIKEQKKVLNISNGYYIYKEKWENKNKNIINDIFGEII